MGNKTRIRVMVPIDLDIDSAHLEEIKSPEWAEQMYSFASNEEVGLYVACLMINGLETSPLSRFDGHAHQPVDVATLKLADIDDEGWQVE